MRTYTTKLLKTVIKNKNETNALLELRFPNAEKKFNLLANLLYKQLKRIRTVFPEAEYSITTTIEGDFHLLLGNFHDVDSAESFNYKLIAVSAKIKDRE